MATPSVRPMRLSNMELLRIISMFMVLLVHADGASLGLPSTPAGSLEVIGPKTTWKLFVESFAIIGVNCFTLISGYFGIRLSWKGIAGYLFQCVFYAVGISTVFLLLWPQHTEWDTWLSSWLVLSHTDLWYVPAYFALMLIAPFLNKGCDNLSKLDFTVALGLFVVFNLWCGWWWEGKFNPTGYTIIQLIMVYLIGRGIKLYVPSGWLRRRAPLVAIIYGITVVGIFLSSVWMEASKAFAYNSPLVLASSVAFTMLFTAFEFRSKIVNYVALSSFAVYLLHKTPLLWVYHMKPTVIKMWRASDSLWEFSGKLIILLLAIYAFAMVVDAVRRFIWKGILSTFQR